MFVGGRGRKRKKGSSVKRVRIREREKHITYTHIQRLPLQYAKYLLSVQSRMVVLTA